MSSPKESSMTNNRAGDEVPGGLCGIRKPLTLSTVAVQLGGREKETSHPPKAKPPCVIIACAARGRLLPLLGTTWQAAALTHLQR